MDRRMEVGLGGSTGISGTGEGKDVEHRKGVRARVLDVQDTASGRIGAVEDFLHQPSPRATQRSWRRV